MRKNIILPGVAVIAGLVGLGLRKWELATAFDPETGVHLAAAATPVLLLWSALVVLALVLLCRDCKNSAPFDVTFRAEKNAVYLAVCVLAAFLLLASGGVELLGSAMRDNLVLTGGGTRFSALMRPLRIVLCVLGFFCVLAIAKNLFKGLGKGKDSLAILGLCLLFCVWLISEYQNRAADSILLHYAYSIFAILAALLGLYHLAGYSFQNRKPRCTAVFFLLAVYLSLVTMADRHTFAELLRYGFAVLFLTAHAVLLLREHSAGEVPTETEDHHA